MQGTVYSVETLGLGEKIDDYIDDLKRYNLKIVKANGKVKFFELLDERPEIRQAIVDQLLGNNNGGIKDGSEDGE